MWVPSILEDCEHVSPTAPMFILLRAHHLSCNRRLNITGSREIQPKYQSFAIVSDNQQHWLPCRELE